MSQRSKTAFPSRFFGILTIAVAVAAGNGQAKSAPPTASNPPVTSPIAFPAICDASDVPQILGRNGPLGRSPAAGNVLLQQRIGACKSTIAKFLASLSTPVVIARNPPGLPPLQTPSPNPTFPIDCKSALPDPNNADVSQAGLYSTLTYCVKWIAKYAGASASSSPTPQPLGFHTPPPGSNLPWTKVVYVLSLAADANTAALTSLQLANNLRSPAMHPDLPEGIDPTPKPDLYSDRLVRYSVVAAPSWKLADYQQQCFNDPSTAGAIVALQPGSQSNAINAIVYGQSFTNVNMQLMVLDCAPTNTSYVNSAAYVVWLSHVRYGYGPRRYMNLSTLLGALAVALAFQSTTVKTYNIRRPESIKHGETYERSYTVQSAGSSESTAAVGIASAFSSANIGQSTSVDGQTASAIESVLPMLVNDLMWTCNFIRPGYNEFPQPQCAWFSLRPKKQPPP
jgi:hypothetical protein